MAAEEVFEQALASIKPLPSGSSPIEGGFHAFHSFLSKSSPALLRLYFLFSKNLKKALRILDNGGVTKVIAEPSGRVAFQVAAESEGQTIYTCFPEHFCSCASFHFEVVSRGEQLGCKHQLAARLATSLNIFKKSTMPDEQLALRLYRM